jgi:sodium transport system permease protein
MRLGAMFTARLRRNPMTRAVLSKFARGAQILAVSSTVFCKELVDVLRDRRTLIFMLVIPTVAIPVLMWVTSELMTHFMEKLAREQVDVLVLNPEAAPELVEEVKKRANPLGRARRVAELLKAKGVGESELAMTKGEPRAFLRLLEKKGIDPEELATELRVAVEDSDFKLEPGAIIQNAFPPNFRLVTELDPRDYDHPAEREQVLLEAVRTDEIAAAIEFADDALEKLASGDSTEIRVYYLDASDRSSTALSGLRRIFKSLGKQMVAERLLSKELPAGFANPVKVRPERLPGPGMLVKFLSQILPYMILIFAFMGAMYPAIDLGAGEKERGTLETLLVAPVSRLSIVLGKFGVILVAALVSAVLATISLSVSLYLGIFSTISLVSGGSFSFSIQEALVALLMIVPISGIFAALLLALSIFAKSFKEGQSYASPLQMVIIMPAFVSFVPGVKLDWLMASIPVVNVSLALKEIFTGNLDQHWAHVGVIFLSTSIFAGLLLWFATWWFQREQVLFRS